MARDSSRLSVALVALLLGAGLAIRWRIRQLEPHAATPEVVARVQVPQASPSPERADGQLMGAALVRRPP
ncbi:MAG TPA: hypothetical protein VGK30_17255 [Candidatus Binatia bacterium]|jgi:hypothetical protein